MNSGVKISPPFEKCEWSVSNFKSTCPTGKTFWICIGNKTKSLTRYNKCVNDEKKYRETTYSKLNGDAQKRANDLELEVQNLTKIIQKQQETNIQL